jgi:cytochrome P450
MSKLISAARESGSKRMMDMDFLSADAMVIIIAGSDTVSIALTFLFYHLALFPEHLARLRQELASVDVSSNRALQSLPHLNALINETLRLYPPVPTAPLRQTPLEGLRIGNTLIPGGVTISVPLWSLGRLESSYVKAKEFLPERWLPGSGMILNDKGFAPFLMGTHSCPGKQLALMELRIATANLVTRYDFTFPDKHRSNVLDIKDCFTINPGPLELLFSARS